MGTHPRWLAVGLATVAATLLPAAQPAASQQRFSIADILTPAFPTDLVASRDVDRVAWIEYERGMRNVYTAAAPDFRPVRLTSWTEDDGRDLSGLEISADGRIIMMIRGHVPNREGWVANPMSDADGAERAAWAVPSSGGEPWRIAQADDPDLSPDGRWIVYSRDGAIYRSATSPGAVTEGGTDAAEPLFRAFGNSGSPVWSPDSKRLAFVSQRGDHSYIGVYDLDGHTIRYLAPGVDRDGSPAWSPDGTRVAFLRRPGAPFAPVRRRGTWWMPQERPESTSLPDGLHQAGFEGGHTLEIWVADARTGEGERLWHSWPGEERFTDLRALTWAGDHLVFASEPGATEGHRYAISVSDPRQEPVELTPGKGMVEHVGFSADGRWLYYSANIGDVDRRHLWRAPVAGGSPEQLTWGDEIDTYLAVLDSGRRVAVLRAGPKRPLAPALLDVETGTARYLRELPAAFPMNAHVVPEPVVITAEDGVQTHGQLFLPPNRMPGEKLPALVFIHGGPYRQMLLGYNDMHFYHMAYAMNQYFANEGYVTLSINYRSGIGYGTAFRNPTEFAGSGNSEYRDVIAAGRFLQRHPGVDSARVGLWGGSYGGVLTAQGLARNSDVFKAGMDYAGIHLWGEGVDPESITYRSSSISAIDEWTSPVLLIQGDDDRNVPFSQTVSLVQLLRAHGIEHELIVFPDEVHDLLAFSHWMEVFRATDDFFQRKLRGGEAAAPENEGIGAPSAQRRRQ